MRRIITFILTILINSVFAQTTGYTVLKALHQKYKAAPCKCYTFSQKNKHFQNDSLVKESVWHEAIEFPDKFRINFGAKEEGNYVVFKNDSMYRYKGHQFIKSKADSNSLLLILGGMFYRNLNEVENRLLNHHYNLSICSEQTWNGESVYVIGALINQLNVNQLWLDKKTFKVLRIIEQLNETDWMDMRFESHQPWCKGYVETKVSFRRNGKLEQVEEYYDLKPASKFED